MKKGLTGLFLKCLCVRKRKQKNEDHGRRLKQFTMKTSVYNTLPSRHNDPFYVVECSSLSHEQGVSHRIEDCYTWLKDEGIQETLASFDGHSLIEALPAPVANDVLLKCHSFLDRLSSSSNASTTPSEVVQALYSFMETRLNHYAEFMDIKVEREVNKIRELCESYMVARTFYTSPRDEMFIRAKFIIKIEAASDFLIYNHYVLTEEEQSLINLTSLSLKSLSSDRFLNWKWWSISQWGKNIESLARSRHRIRALHGDYIFLAMHSLFLVRNLAIQEELRLARDFGHLHRLQDAVTASYWNILAFAVEAIEVLGQYAKRTLRPSIHGMLQTAFDLVGKNEGGKLATANDAGDFHTYFDLQIQQPPGWKAKLKRAKSLNKKKEKDLQAIINDVK